MSLLIWLPLDGNLNNLGIASCTVSSTGLTVNNTGKIGKCYSFSGSNSGITINNYSFSGNNLTACCWVYPTGSPSSHLWIMRFENRNGNSTSESHFSMHTTGSSPRTVCFAINGLSSLSSTATLIPANTWSHVALVKQENVLIAYINGVEVFNETRSGTNAPNILRIGGASASYDNSFSGWMNDVRFYNNALSADEVAEIAKGLCLHYPLIGAPVSNLHNYNSISPLPAEYLEVEYIESTGSEYINTGWVPTVDCGVVAKGAFLSYVGSAPLIGSGPGSVNRFFPLSLAGERLLRFTYGSSEYFFNNYNYGDEIFVTFNKPVRKLYINGELKNTYGNTYTVSTLPLYLFGVSGYGSNLYLNQSRLWFVRIFDNGDLIKRNLIPCYRISDKKPGMYDTINEVFYTNASGAGEFICGPLVKSIPNTYIPLEWIASNKDAWINCNLATTANTRYVGEYMVTAAGASLWMGALNGMYYGFTNTNAGIGGHDEYTIEYNQWYKYDIRYTTTNGKFYLNNILVLNYDRLYTTNTAINLFSLGGSQYCAAMKHKNYLCYLNNVLLRDMRPALRISDKKPGMYDLVNDVFYVNNGSNEFTYNTLENIEYDISGFKHHGRYSTNFYQALLPSISRYPVTYDFNTNQYLNTEPDNVRWHLGLKDFTISVWLKSNSWSGSLRDIIGCTESGGFLIRIATNGTVLAWINSGGYVSPVTTDTLSTTDWNHIVFIVKQGAFLKLYMNNILKLNETISGNVTYNSSTNIFVGVLAASNGGIEPSGYANCLLSDLRVYATCFSDNDVAKLYNMGRLS